VVVGVVFSCWRSTWGFLSGFRSVGDFFLEGLLLLLLLGVGDLSVFANGSRSVATSRLMIFSLFLSWSGSTVVIIGLEADFFMIVDTDVL